MAISARRFLVTVLTLVGVGVWLLPATPAIAGAAVTSVPAYPACASVGSTATINGSGYGPGNILVYMDQTQLQTNPQTVTVQSNGTWTAKFIVPNMALGNYPLYGIGSPDRASTPFCIGAPDLTPTPITFNSATLQVGRTIHFDSGVQNLGTTATGVFNIKWLVDGKDVGAYGSHAGVPAGTTVLNGNSQFDWAFTATGNHVVTFNVDVDNHVAESNESNNSRSIQVTVAGPVNDYPYPDASPSTPDPWGFFDRECTSFVAWRMNHNNGVTFSNGMAGPNGVKGHWGNAYEWTANANRIGYGYNLTPARGSVAWYAPNSGGAGASGHVAYVFAVKADGSLIIEDYNAAGTHVYSTRTIAKGSSSWPSQFIHIRDLP